MRRLFLFAAIFVAMSVKAQTETLPKPDMNRSTLTVMQTFQKRKSDREFSDRALSKQDLSDLLWAAQGKNRDNGNLTAPTAMNRQEIRVYVVTQEGISLYDPKEHSLTQVCSGDHRSEVADRQTQVKNAPVMLLMAADIEKFGSSDTHSLQMMAVDAGIVCENINIFCAATGMKTVPRATMNQQALRRALNLPESCILLLNNPVGW